MFLCCCLMARKKNINERPLFALLFNRVWRTFSPLNLVKTSFGDAIFCIFKVVSEETDLKIRFHEFTISPFRTFSANPLRCEIATKTLSLQIFSNSTVDKNPTQDRNGVCYRQKHLSCYVYLCGFLFFSTAYTHCFRGTILLDKGKNLLYISPKKHTPASRWVFLIQSLRPGSCPLVCPSVSPIPFPVRVLLRRGRHRSKGNDRFGRVRPKELIVQARSRIWRKKYSIQTSISIPIPPFWDCGRCESYFCFTFFCVLQKKECFIFPSFNSTLIRSVGIHPSFASENHPFPKHFRNITHPHCFKKKALLAFRVPGRFPQPAPGLLSPVPGRGGLPGRLLPHPRQAGGALADEEGGSSGCGLGGVGTKEDASQAFVRHHALGCPPCAHVIEVL